MAKSVSDPVLDAAHNYIKNATGLTQILCNAQPTTRADAVGSMALADVALAAADVVVSDAPGGGRRATVAAKAGVAVDTGGTGNHIALVSATELLRVTTCTAVVVTGGGAGTVDFPAWTFDIGDPT